MATGADHYREAEEALKLTRATHWDSAADRDALIKIAQVHATLAATPKANDDEYWAQAKALEYLHAAVRELLDSEGGPIGGTWVGVEPGALARLRALLGSPS
jgi:hypothetical protein